MPKKEVAPRILLAMAVARLTRRQLAERSGVPYLTLTRFLAGTRGLPHTAIPALADALGISCDWLLTGEPARIDPQALDTAAEMALIAVPGLNKVTMEVVEAFCVHFVIHYNIEYLRRLGDKDRAAGLSQAFLRRYFDQRNPRKPAPAATD